MSDANVFVGKWTYRSWLDEVDPEIEPDKLLFGLGTIEILEAPMEILEGSIGGKGWSLELHGSRSYGNPMTICFRGKGMVSGAEWIYDYVGYLVPEWPGGVNQKTALVGSIVRVIPHPSGNGGISPAGLVASWYAVKEP